MKKLTALILVLCAWSLPAPAAPPPTAESLIAAAKQATGGPAWDKIVTWHEKGTGTAGGLHGTYENWMDLPTLHNSGGYTIGPMSGGSGWDGTHVWSTDSSKQVRIEESAQAVADAMQDAYRSAYALFFPDRASATKVYVGTRHADGKIYDAVKVTPKNADPFEVWFDPTTHRIAREVQLTGDQPHTYLFSDYAPFGGILVPRTLITRVANDPKYDIVLHASTIVLGGPQEISRYAPPPPPVDTSTWPAGKDSVTLPFHLINNHIYLEASINGHAPVPFMFDTGATNVIQAPAAKSFGISAKGALPGGGFGDKVAPFGVGKVKSVSLAGFTLYDQVFITEESPEWVAIEGTDSDGLVGYEFAKRAVLTIDYAKRTMTFTKPQDFHPPAGVESIPFTFDNHVPVVAGTLDGIPGQYELDTGSRDAVTLMAPFVKAHDLIARDHATIVGTVGYGVGGPATALLGRAGKLTLGPVSVDAPIVEVSTNKSGGGSETHMAGNIGGDILKRFTVTLDYAHHLLWLQPNEPADQPEVFDRSGLWIMRAKDGGIDIADVTTQSPAAKLGLAKGDEILSVNGKPARDVSLYGLREQFEGPPGTPFNLALKSPTAPKTVTLVLANQV